MGLFIGFSPRATASFLMPSPASAPAAAVPMRKFLRFISILVILSISLNYTLLSQYASRAKQRHLALPGKRIEPGFDFLSLN
jgi:hypothetical protein